MCISEEEKMGRLRLGKEYLTVLPICRRHCCRGCRQLVPHILGGWRVTWSERILAIEGAQRLRTVRRSQVGWNEWWCQEGWGLGSLCRINTNGYIVWDAKEKTESLPGLGIYHEVRYRLSGRYNICYDLWVLPSNSVHRELYILKNYMHLTSDKNIILAVLWELSGRKNVVELNTGSDWRLVHQSVQSLSVPSETAEEGA